MQPQPTTAAANTSTLQSMQALPEAALRQTVLGERLTHHHPADASALIHHILHGATSGDPASRTAAVALAQWILAEPDGSPILAQIHTAASTAGHLAVAAILGAGPGRCALAPLGRLPEIGIPVEGPLNVARGSRYDIHRSRVRVQRLLQHHDPKMIRRLVEARWIRLDHVVALAARRPTTEGIVRAICAAPRWLLHAEVRAALAANPFTPASVVLPLLPTLPRIELRRLRSGAASPQIADAAQLLLDLGLPSTRLP